MAVEVGSEAPDFALVDQNRERVTLSSFRGERAVLLIFYPLAFTGICTGELCALRDDLPAFQNDKVQVLTISVDSAYTHKVFAEREGYEFPLLSDFWPHGGVAQLYGVFNDRSGFANRGTFLIDAEGIVRFAEVQRPGRGTRSAELARRHQGTRRRVAGPAGDHLAVPADRRAERETIKTSADGAPVAVGESRRRRLLGCFLVRRVRLSRVVVDLARGSLHLGAGHCQRCRQRERGEQVPLQDVGYMLRLDRTAGGVRHVGFGHGHEPGRAGLPGEQFGVAVVDPGAQASRLFPRIDRLDLPVVQFGELVGPLVARLDTRRDVDVARGRGIGMCERAAERTVGDEAADNQESGSGVGLERCEDGVTGVVVDLLLADERLCDRVVGAAGYHPTVLDVVAGRGCAGAGHRQDRSHGLDRGVRVVPQRAVGIDLVGEASDLPGARRNADRRDDQHQGRQRGVSGLEQRAEHIVNGTAVVGFLGRYPRLAACELCGPSANAGA